jgi:hypothetical protein
MWTSRLLASLRPSSQRFRIISRLNCANSASRVLFAPRGSVTSAHRFSIPARQHDWHHRLPAVQRLNRRALSHQGPSQETHPRRHGGLRTGISHHLCDRGGDGLNDLRSRQGELGSGGADSLDLHIGEPLHVRRSQQQVHRHHIDRDRRAASTAHLGFFLISLWCSLRRCNPASIVQRERSEKWNRRLPVVAIRTSCPHFFALMATFGPRNV